MLGNPKTKEELNGAVQKAFDLGYGPMLSEGVNGKANDASGFGGGAPSAAMGPEPRLSPSPVWGAAVGFLEFGKAMTTPLRWCGADFSSQDRALQKMWKEGTDLDGSNTQKATRVAAHVAATAATMQPWRSGWRSKARRHSKHWGRPR